MIYAGWGRDEGKSIPETHLESFPATDIPLLAAFTPQPLHPQSHLHSTLTSDFVHVHLCGFEHECYPKDLFQTLVLLKGLSVGKQFT